MKIYQVASLIISFPCSLNSSVYKACILCWRFSDRILCEATGGLQRESIYIYLKKKIILAATWSLDGGGSQVESRRPFRSTEDFSREDMPVASFSVAVMKTVVKTDLR